MTSQRITTMLLAFCVIGLSLFAQETAIDGETPELVIEPMTWHLAIEDEVRYFVASNTNRHKDESLRLAPGLYQTVLPVELALKTHTKFPRLQSPIGTRCTAYRLVGGKNNKWKSRVQAKSGHVAIRIMESDGGFLSIGCGSWEMIR